MILQKMLSFMEKEHMLEDCRTLILGVSGGADSVCLLLLMQEVCRQNSIKVHVVHVEHGIRGKDSLDDAKFVEELCRSYDIPFVQYSFDVIKIAEQTGESIEEAGRRLRYEVFEKEADKQESAKIAVAHNQNDNAETILLNMARGTGIRGLGGIPAVRGRIIRPLLCLSRTEIEEYLAQKEQHYCIDRTNLSDAYARNRIRHDALPALESVNERAIYHMEQLSSYMTEAMDYLDKEAKHAFEVCMKDQKDDSVELKADALMKYPDFLKQQVLYEALVAVTGHRKDITREHVAEMKKLLQKQVSKSVNLPYGCIAKKTYDGIMVFKESAKDDNVSDWNLEREREKFSFRVIENTAEIGEIPKNKYTKWLDYDKIKARLQIRTRQEGDFFFLSESGHQKRLKSYFINEKIPKEKRDRVILLADGKHIAWIVGYRISAYYKVTNNTKRILEVQFNGGKKHE